MKKQVITLNVDHYYPEITSITLPFMERFAKKIGADFNVITERTFGPPMTCNYEKFQLRKLSKGYDWTIYLDADVLIHNDTPDFTDFIGKETILFHAFDTSPIRFRTSNYNRRSGTLRGACTWCVMFSDWTAEDLWTPLRSTSEWEKTLVNIYPTTCELNSATPLPEHYIDDYILTQNVSRFGLKTDAIANNYSKWGIDFQCIYHLYAVDLSTKIKHLQGLSDIWIRQKYEVDNSHVMRVVTSPVSPTI